MTGANGGGTGTAVVTGRVKKPNAGRLVASSCARGIGSASLSKRDKPGVPDHAEASSTRAGVAVGKTGVVGVDGTGSTASDNGSPLKCRHGLRTESLGNTTGARDVSPAGNVHRCGRGTSDPRRIVVVGPAEFGSDGNSTDRGGGSRSATAAGIWPNTGSVEACHAQQPLTATTKVAAMRLRPWPETFEFGFNVIPSANMIRPGVSFRFSVGSGQWAVAEFSVFGFQFSDSGGQVLGFRFKQSEFGRWSWCLS
jgi:hypothetical protein